MPLAMQFPLLGLARDFHPLDNAHAEHTANKKSAPLLVRSFLKLFIFFIDWQIATDKYQYNGYRHSDRQSST